jgi:glycosyltransferase involved in cell wall biosynthesis
LTTNPKRLKVLISAYSCGPDMGSEPGIGWNTVCQAARHHEVWVITRRKNQEAIERALAAKDLPGVRFVYFDYPRWARFWKKGSRGVHLYFYLWQLGASFAAKKLLREVRFDVAHHITFGTYSYPSFLSLLNVPYIWGPVGGGESAPFAFWKTMGWRGFLFESVRTAARKRGEFDPLTRRTAQKAAVAMATTAETAKRISAMGAGRILTQSVAALNEDDLQVLQRIPTREKEPFRIFSVGRLLHWKGFHLGLEAFAWLAKEHPGSEYWLIGDGPERQQLEGMASRLGVGQAVTFFGNISRSETLRKITECDAMLFPSLHDSGGWASVEAMAAGRPVVCLDLGGPAVQVTQSTGYKIAARDPRQTIKALGEALLSLAKDRILRERMSEACRQRVRDEFNWDHVGQVFESLYQEVSGSRQSEESKSAAEFKQNILNPRSPQNVSLGREA